MGGYSGKAVASHTPLVWCGGQQFAVTPAQHRLIDRALRDGGALHVMGAEVRTARALSLFGDLRDDGALTTSGEGNPDGERWTFTLKEGVSLVAPSSPPRPVSAGHTEVSALKAEVERMRTIARNALRADCNEFQVMIDALRSIAGGTGTC